jgi:formate dehydrogenase major subunit
MTNQIQDMKMSDAFMVCGSNVAENHPISMKWINEAMSRPNNPAKMIVVDPRFTRTAARATIFAQTRPGTDITFFGGLINYAIQNNMINWDFVHNYTNASFLVDPNYSFNPETGQFSGYKEVVDPKTGAKKKSYDFTTWAYQLGPDGKPLKDPTLNNPQSVWQQMIKHYSRYTAEKVSKVTGIPVAKFEEVAKAYCSTFERGKSGVLLYAMGLTQHTYGSQNIRTFAMLQLLLGNVGVPGGGIAALRGCANVQGSTDQALLSHLLPGYLGMPNSAQNSTLVAYNEQKVKAAGSSYFSNTPKFMVSYLKAMYGDAATRDSEFGYKWFPRVKQGVNYTHIALFEAMYAGTVKGLFVVGQNPAVGGPNSNMETAAMDKLDWLVVSEIFETETAVFWKRPGVNPASVNTEVFLLPAAANTEYEGTYANTGRVVQWFYKTGEPKGVGKQDLDIFTALVKKLKELYQADQKAPNRESIVNLYWPHGDAVISEDVLREMNGFVWDTKKQVPGFAALKDDGSTACGNWVFSGVFPAESDYPGMTDPDPAKVAAAKLGFAKTGGNLAKRTNNEDKGNVAIYPGWAWCWPANRRIVYNRLSADPAGQPWSADKTLVKWDGTKWVNTDVPDFSFVDATKPDKPPVPPNVSAGNPFIMNNYGMGWLFAAGGGLVDGPFPEHYEPIESPFKNSMNGSQNSPVVKIWNSEMDKLAAVGDPNYPIICGIARVTEHFQSGTMTRNIPWLVEMQPNMFVEMSKSLAKRKGIKNGQWVTVKSIRGEVDCVALVTDRIQVLTVNSKTADVVMVPYHFGFTGLSTGGPGGKNYAGNQLSPNVGDCNTTTPEYKAFLVNIEKA